MLARLARLLRRRRRLEFLLCASPSEEFYSQIAFFRYSLDSLGAAGSRSRVVATLGASEYPAMPLRWRHHLRRVEVVRADPAVFAREGSFAASDLRFELLDPRADLSCLCDADTALLRPIPTELLDRLERRPAVCAVVAHFPPPLAVDARTLEPPRHLYPGMPHEQGWDTLGELILGRAVERPFAYTLLETTGDRGAPFVPNYGFVASTPELLTRLCKSLREIQPKLKPLIGNDFYGQIAIALAVQRDDIPIYALPMRFNFPNDRAADRLHRGELDEIVVLHYLRTQRFDRSRIFVDEREFTHFLELELEGSDRVFQTFVRRVTGGRYPFN